MNTTLSPTTLRWALIILFISSILTSLCTAGDNQQCYWIPVDQNDFNKVLIMIESRVKKNYEKIKTWQGKTKIVSDTIREGDSAKSYYETMTDVRTLPDKIIAHHEFVREFVLDAARESLYENNYLDGQNYIMNANTGEIIPLKDGANWGSGKYIHTPEYHINLFNNKNRDGDIVSHTVIKQALRRDDEQKCGEGYLSPVFDPRNTIRIFGDIFGKTSDPLGGTFTKYLNLFDKEPLIDGHPTITVEECVLGGIKRYRITLTTLTKDSNGVTVHLFNKLVCSSDVGFNVVSYSLTTASGKILREKTFEYDLFNGVYLPVQKIELDFDYHTCNLKEQSLVTFFNEKVNEPINEEVFTYNNLGLQDGDKFIDKIENKEYRYRAATKTLEPITE